MTTTPIAIHWFRRDLRLFDNHALYQALISENPVLCLFIFDTNILDSLPRDDKRVTFIYQSLQKIDAELRALGSGLLVRIGKPDEIWTELVQQYSIKAVYTNHDYEPYAKLREHAVVQILNRAGAALHTFKDQVIHECDEVLKDDGTPYTVYTPYSKKWKLVLQPSALESFPSEKNLHACYKGVIPEMPSLGTVGFKTASIDIPPVTVSDALISNYHETRDFPAVQGTSKLSVHLRFGTISVRALTRKAMALNEKYYNELIWREFYQMILWHFPHVVKGAFRKEYDRIVWRNNESEFEAWCKGMTGYPIVDAGMRELNATGWMHNRVRMIVASFLTKDLLIDWRWGEAYFAEKLLDFDLASNNGGWQWAAGTGVDAAPYFRIFNPSEQTKKFDPNGKYIRTWVPELDTMQYPLPIVDHALARQRTLQAYKLALQ